MSRSFLRLSAACLLSLVLVGCAIGQHGPSSTGVTLLEETRPPVRVGELVWRGTLELRDDRGDFGGISSLRVSPDGTQFVAISDRGKRVAGRLTYDKAGDLAGAGDYSIAPLLGPDGQALPSGQNDTEGLALLGIWPGDGWAVSREREHAILRYPPTLAGAPAARVDGPSGITELPNNSGLETLLSLPNGRLLAIAEDDAGDGRHRAWVGRSGNWLEFTYQALTPFLPVDAATLPDGGILILERRVGYLGGWGSRVVHVDAPSLAASLVPGGVMQGRELARLDPPMVTDNYEGIDTRALPGGGIALYLVSDNNFRPILQRTLLTMFVWKR